MCINKFVAEIIHNLKKEFHSKIAKKIAGMFEKMKKNKINE